MHHLFQLVLEQKDLSRAGDLFSLDDFEIEGSLSEALEQIRIISSSSDYQTNDNDQAVVEICITRITTAIRETETIEKHGQALVSLWESCLEHNLKPPAKDEDTPHAKIASDIMSCILQNYNKPTIMSLAVPLAVRFLQQGNKELCRNMSNYICLVAIAKADLLVDHVEAILRSILQGNSMLLRVLPSVYDMRPQPIHHCLRDLVSQMSHLNEGEQHHMLRLLQAIAKTKQPKVLTETVPFLMEYLSDPSYSDIILNILLDISSYEPLTLTGSLSAMKEVSEHFPGLIGQIAKIYGAVGHVNETMAKMCLTYLVNQLNNMEHSFHHLLLTEIKNITNTFNEVLAIPGRDMCRMSNSLTAIAKILNEHLTDEAMPACRKESSIQEEPAFYVQDTHQSFFHSGCGEKMEGGIQTDSNRTGRNDAAFGTICLHNDIKVSNTDSKDMAFNRSKNSALKSSSTKCLNLDSNQDPENVDIVGLMSFSHMFLHHDNERLPSGSNIDESQMGKVTELVQFKNCIETKGEIEPEYFENQKGVIKEPHNEHDTFFQHLKDNINELKNYVTEMGKKIPVPDQCVIEVNIFYCSLTDAYDSPQMYPEARRYLDYITGKLVYFISLGYNMRTFGGVAWQWPREAAESYSSGHSFVVTGILSHFIA
ncbi:PREDICTED: ventricular zone-expressed PH domain-containing protein homolog 1-like [Nanorana parkeri]|uniref:ventricular zone-expressed PH domain-containing protein homolog 1-like n=1 Tax=Nanorana parkeri TaxID=125878 RepID=UPI000854F9C5|nr:PREDICTED: ventricular zone-expressed PH domain-containing protein homolog 1-like [Nanorana parkeri]